MQWYKLTADPNDLQAAILETKQLRVTSMSTALLTVFIDSAKNLKVIISVFLTTIHTYKYRLHFPSIASSHQLQT